MPRSHHASADQDGLHDCQDADERSHGCDEQPMVDVISDVCGDGGAEEGWNGTECGDRGLPISWIE